MGDIVLFLQLTINHTNANAHRPIESRLLVAHHREQAVHVMVVLRIHHVYLGQNGRKISLYL